MSTATRKPPQPSNAQRASQPPSHARRNAEGENYARSSAECENYARSSAEGEKQSPTPSANGNGRVRSIQAQAVPTTLQQMTREAIFDWAKLKAKAEAAPRCHHRKADGVRCGSPALRGRRFCYFHNRLRLRRNRQLSYLPSLGGEARSERRNRASRARGRSRRSRRGALRNEDANGIQCAIMEVTRTLLQNKIDRKTAGLLLYALQTASANLKQRVKFEPSPWLLLPNEGKDDPVACDQDEDQQEEENDSNSADDTDSAQSA